MTSVNLVGSFQSVFSLDVLSFKPTFLGGVLGGNSFWGDGGEEGERKGGGVGQV